MVDLSVTLTFFSFSYAMTVSGKTCPQSAHQLHIEEVFAGKWVHKKGFGLSLTGKYNGHIKMYK